MFKKPIAKVLRIDVNNLNAYSTGLLQGKAYRALNTELTKTLFQYDLSIPEWKLLGQVYDNGDMRLAELADRLSVEAPLVTKLVGRLQKKKLVQFKNDPTDKRAKIISTTKKTTMLIPEIEKGVKNTLRVLLHGLSLKDLRTYMRVLETIVTNAEQR